MKARLSIIFLGFCLLMISACGGNKSTVPVAEQNKNDITRPPQFEKAIEDVKESNPEETISFDEWKKQQNQ